MSLLQAQAASGRTTFIANSVAWTAESRPDRAAPTHECESVALAIVAAVIEHEGDAAELEHLGVVRSRLLQLPPLALRRPLIQLGPWRSSIPHGVMPSQRVGREAAGRDEEVERDAAVAD